METTIKLKTKKITKESFKKFGQFIDNNTSETPTIKTESVTFWKQQIQTVMGEAYEIGLLKVKKQEMIFDELENHFQSPTGLISLDGDFKLALGVPSDKIPSKDDIEAFDVPAYQMLMIDAKCWHGVCYPQDKDEITILVFMAKDALENDTVNKKLDNTFEIC